MPIDALRINDHYDVSFLKEHGEEIKRVVVPEYAYSNSILLSHCPNIEEFIVAKIAVSHLRMVFYIQHQAIPALLNI